MIFHKNINKNIIAILGSWDPLLPRHRAIFKRLLTYSKKKGLNPYVIIVYPNPAIFIYGSVYKDYFDLPARIELFKHLGINNVLVLDIGGDDLLAGVEGVFNELAKDSSITLKELWIGENQYFGSGEKGVTWTTEAQCAQRNIKLTTLKNSFRVVIDKDDVMRNFKSGQFDQAATVVGDYPTYFIKDDLHIKMYDGIYDSRLRINPFDKTNEIPVTAKIANEQLEEIERPDGYYWLVLLGVVGNEQ
jgi:FAD synthase